MFHLFQLWYLDTTTNNYTEMREHDTKKNTKGNKVCIYDSDNNCFGYCVSTSKC